MNNTNTVRTSVRHLLPGDRLGTGEVVQSRPYSQVRTPKGRLHVHLRHPDGKSKAPAWNASTTITVIREVV